ncbi:MAG TPA: aldo/keto reductase [Thermoanaerobaculia bacterium]|nr:aldo/keto reductase [Thermoanaerobaculia bacterium]
MGRRPPAGCRSCQNPYSPFGSGSFPARQSRGGRALAEIAAARGVSPHQVALAFLVRQAPLFAIPKAARREHAEANAAAAAIDLDAGEVRRIDEAFPRGRRQSGVPTI